MDRINESIAHHLSRLILEEVADPRLATMITITKVETAKDLKTAKVYLSVLDTGKRGDVLAGLRHAERFFIERLKELLAIRYIPTLTFIYDDSIERMSTILGKIKALENERKGNDSKET